MRLGTGYSQMINLSATPDLSAASYRIDGNGADPAANLGVLHLPYQRKWTALSPGVDLYWKVEAGWLKYRQDFPWNGLAGETGSIGSKWSAYSIGGGLLAKIRLGKGFTVEPALAVGIARLQNKASYAAGAGVLGPVLDGLLFNWSADAWFVTPGVALEWKGTLGDGEATVTGHLAR